jgi:predicted metal-dependent hydrolase
VAGRTVLQGGRAKAYRPLARRKREAALADAIAAYERGDFFLAHELLEPAWMGTADAAERELHQGLIKLAAAYVHGVRGNPAGIAKNLTGARERLATAASLGGADGGLDLSALLAAIDARIARLPAAPGEVAADPPSLPRRIG